MDDDDFDYDEDYSFEDSDGQDEEIRQEFELDEIIQNTEQAPEDSIVKLTKIAETYTSNSCIRAAAELHKLKMNSCTFRLLVNAVAQAPSDVDTFTRASAIESGWKLLEKSLGSSEESDEVEILLSIQRESFVLLTKFKQYRSYFQLVLCGIDTFRRLNDYAKAIDLLRNVFYGQIARFDLSNVWVQPLLHEARILELEILVVYHPIDIYKAISALEVVRTSEIVMNPLQSCLVDELDARICLARNLLKEARALLEKVVRSQGELQGTRNSSRLPTNSAALLILTSAVLEEYIPEKEVRGWPSTNGNIEILHHALSISRYIQNPVGDTAASDFTNHCILLQRMSIKNVPILGIKELMAQVKDCFLKRQLEYALEPYTRIRWSSLESQIIEFQRPDLYSAHSTVRRILNKLTRAPFYQLNLIDHTVDRNDLMPNWGSCKTYSELLSRSVPLPEKYAKYKASQELKSKESEILNKWKHAPNRQSSVASELSSQHSILNREHDLVRLLQDTLDDHRTIMMG